MYIVYIRVNTLKVLDILFLKHSIIYEIQWSFNK